MLTASRQLYRADILVWGHPGISFYELKTTQFHFVSVFETSCIVCMSKVIMMGQDINLSSQ